MCNLDLNINALKDVYEKSMKNVVTEDINKIELKYMETSSDFSKFAANRNVSIAIQFTELFKRNIIYLYRNPRGLKGVFFNGLFTGIL